MSKKVEEKFLTYAERQAIRGMLKDKQSAKTIADEFSVSVEIVQALAPPKAVSD